MFLPRLLLLAAASLGISAATGPAQVQLSSTAGTSTSATYPRLGLAFAAINAGTHQGAITIDLTGNTNEGTTSASLDASGRFNAVYTSVLIRPSGGAARTISGATTAGSAMIVYNGASNVTIDGLNSGGNSLTITNTTASAAAVTGTFRFKDGASNNVITRATVLGSFTGPAGTTGGTIVFANDAVAGTGCDNNTISFCNLGPAGASLPTKAIQGSGATSSAAAGNSGMVITGNNIFDYFAPTGTSAGIYVDAGCANWTISNNRFYQTAARSFTGTTAAPHAAIFVNESQATTGAQGFTITGNVIGFANAAGTGTYALSGGAGAFTGIFFSGIADGALSTISNNTIANVSLTGVTSSGGNVASPFVGIRVNPGNAEVSDNLIGSVSAADSLVFSTTATAGVSAYGIYSNAAGAAFTANRNRIGGMTMGSTATTASVLLGGLGMEATADFAFNADANVVGTAAAPMRCSSASTGAQAVGLVSGSVRCNFTANTIQNLSASGSGTTDASSVNGIRITATTRAHTVARNLIFDLSNPSTSTLATVSGIQFASSATAGTSLISQNVIRQIGFTSTNASSRVNGIALAGGSNTVERNFIHSFRAIAAGEVSGLYINGGSGLYRNNMIRLGILPNGASDTNGVVTYGINQLVGSPDSYFHNSVYVGGTGVTGTARSAAMRNGDPNSTILINNNVFLNARSNASGATGKHFGILLENSNFTTDYNVILAAGTGGLFGARRSAEYAHLVPGWQADVGDEHSFEADPQFINPAADFTAVDLHILPTAATPVESNGLPLSAAETSDDFDGQVRANFTPVDIGADAGNFVTSGGLNPTTNPLSRTVSQGRSLVIPASAFLAASSSNPAGLTIELTGAGPTSAQGGTVTFATNVTYAPPSPQFTGTDSFYYSVRDSAGHTGVGVVNITVQAPAFPALAGSVTRTSGGNFAATFTGGVPGLGYAIEYTDSLTAAFQPLLDANSQPVVVTADGNGGFNFSQAAAVVPERFYRARRQP